MEQYLRLIDEHRVNRKGAQYEGYKRLPAAGDTGTGRPRIETPAAAAAFISDQLKGAVTAEQILAQQWLFETAYKNCARALHPDNKETGDDILFVDLQDAAAVLRAHHGM